MKPPIAPPEAEAPIAPKPACAAKADGARRASFPHRGRNRRRWRRSDAASARSCRVGRKEIDARIDLHGMTQIRAHRVLLTFLQRAHSDGLTFVLVITGKGKVGGAESERGVLRRQVPQWLSLPEFRSLVVGFEEAHIGHGGEGALYVRVRRVRSCTGSMPTTSDAFAHGAGALILRCMGLFS